MTNRPPRTAVNCTDQWDHDALQSADPGDVIEWTQARDRLAAARLFWVATLPVGGGAPHVRPVFAVWIDDRLYSTTNGSRAKARNIAADPSIAVTTSTDEMDFIIEGTAAPVTDEAEMQSVIEAYDTKYGWPLTAREDGFYAPYAAPAAGPPPYRPYVVTPEVIFGFGTSNELAPHSTRYQF
jgi:nitroimidazol reductase NimA-like FMN-containing flavoprotein (pyridoxamine 5'-phosphate oxidase superfamily)